MEKKKVVFLDRDGTLIVDRDYLNDPALIEYLPTTFESLQTLQKSGYFFYIVTNQSGVAKGLVDPKVLDLIHTKMRQDLEVHGIRLLGIAACTADSNSKDYRRKPQPGMILEALELHNIDPHKSWMIGDKKSHVDAGERAGVTSLFLDTGKELPPPGVLTFKTLNEAASHIISRPISN